MSQETGEGDLFKTPLVLFLIELHSYQITCF